MKFQGALIEERWVKFAIVIAKKRVFDSPSESGELIATMQQKAFPGLPVVLMYISSTGRIDYCGREDLVRYLKNVPLEAIPLRKFTLR